VRVASLVIGVVGLVVTLFGTAGFVPFARGVFQSIVNAIVGLLVALWLKIFKPSWQTLFTLFLLVLFAVHLKTTKPTLHARAAAAEAHLRANATMTADAYITRAAIPEAEWRASVDKRLLDLAERLGETRSDLTAVDERLSATVIEQVRALREERNETERRAARLIVVGVACQVVSAFLALFG
jgi:hypothetical protein